MMYYIILTIVLIIIFSNLKSFLKFIKSLIIRNDAEDIKFDLNDFKYEPPTFESCNQLAIEIKKKLIDLGYDKSQLIKNNEKVIDHLKIILKHADQSCCGLIQANGYYAIGKLSFRYLEYIHNELIKTQFRSDSKIEKAESLKEFLEHFEIVSDFVLKLMSSSVRIIKNTDLTNEKTIKDLDSELLKYPEFFRNQPIYRQIKVIKKTGSNDLNSDLDSSYTGGLYSTLTNLVSYSETNQSFTHTPNGQEFVRKF